MPNYSRRPLPSCSLSIYGLGLALTAATACGNSQSTTTIPKDMALAIDLPASVDQAMPADMGLPPDMMSPPDMAPPAVTLPSGCPSSATSAMVYPIVQASCALTNCHGANSNHFQITSMADLQTQWVNVNADQSFGTMKRVTPSNPNRSYLLYKLLGQQFRVSQSGGSQMPLGSTLTPAQICTFVAWVVSGAT